MRTIEERSQGRRQIVLSFGAEPERDPMIKIRVVSHRGKPPTTPREVCLDETGGTMGRLETNQVVLPDPERHVSRVHARIVHRPDGYFILHQGSNPILLNGAKLRLGDQAPLNDGDELVVSPYRLQVAVPPSGAGGDTPILSDGAAQQATIERGLSASMSDGRDAASSPLAAQSCPTQSIEQSLASGGAVDFDLAAGPAGDADSSDVPSSRAELFFSWETDMSWHRATPEEGQPPVKALAMEVGDLVRADDLGASSHPQYSTLEPIATKVSPATADDVGRGPFQPQPGCRSGGNVSFVDVSTRAAIEGALRRFSPEYLEQRLKQRTLLDSVLSINRKAKLWDLFTSMYPQIAREAREEICRAVTMERLTPRDSQMSTANDTDTANDTEVGGS